MGGVYISRDDIKKCPCCGRMKDTREGFCWDCADAESIIGDGIDMYENEMPDKDRLPGNSLWLNRVKFLIVKGWKPPEKS